MTVPIKADDLPKVSAQLLAALGKVDILARRYLELTKAVGQATGADRFGGRLHAKRVSEDLRAIVAVALQSVKLRGTRDGKLRGKFKPLALAGLDDKPVVTRL